MSIEGELVDALLASVSKSSGGICIALSGGADSTALLLSAHAARPHLRGRVLRAVHVDHGLQPEARDFARVCVELCARAEVALEILRPAFEVRVGESIEEQARIARYAALAAHLLPDESLLTAHHAQDQAETFLLMALRGAGVAGLAGMPRRRRLGVGWHLRPFLQIEPWKLRAMARCFASEIAHDAMNGDLRFDRAYLRAEVWPALNARWPASSRTLARSSRHVARALRHAQLAAASAFERVRDGDAICLARLRRLAACEQLDVLRHFLRHNGARAPATRKLEDALRQFLEAAADRAPQVRCERVTLRRFDGRLFADTRSIPPSVHSWDWQGGACALPGSGSLQIRAGEGGLRLHALAKILEVRVGMPATAEHEPLEQFGRWARSRRLKPWMRKELPHIYAENQLLAVGDLWVEPRWRACANDARARIMWRGAPMLF